MALSLATALLPFGAQGDAVADCARIFEAEMRDGVIHGATVLAGGLEGTDVAASWGWADAAHTVSMTPRTVIDMASVTKTAAGIGTFNAGLFSTAEDMAKLMRVYLRGGVCDSGARLFGADEMAQVAPSPTNRVEGARTFGWQSASENLPPELFGTSLFHSGWSGQTVLFNLKSRRFAVVLTTRCGDYKRAKRERFAAIGALLQEEARK